MTWFKVDDSFYDHPKAFDASDAAVALWLRAGTWSARNLTDGFVPDGMLARLSERATDAAAELVRRGLWKRARGGHRFHDWTDYNPTAETVRQQREKRAEAGRLGGLASGKTRRRSGNEGTTNAERSGNEDATKDQRSSNEGASSSRREGLWITPEQQPEQATSRGNDRSKTEASAEANAEHVLGESLNPRPVPTRPDLKGGPSPSVGTDRAPASSEPPSTCEEHRGNPNPPPCGRCADARRTRDRWDADRRRRLEEAPRCRIHRGQPAHNCGPCRSEQLAADREAS